MNRLSFDFLACTDNENWFEFPPTLPPKCFISKSLLPFGFELNKACLMAKFLLKSLAKDWARLFMISSVGRNATSQVRSE